MTKEQAADKLKKLKALAERGVGGERESALKLYHKLLEKYQIDEGEILEERVTLHWFGYKTELEEDLLKQIFIKSREALHITITRGTIAGGRSGAVIVRRLKRWK